MRHRIAAVVFAVAALSTPAFASPKPSLQPVSQLAAQAFPAPMPQYLAAIINEINAVQPIHIVTLEDPIEFGYAQKKATINQRELGQDFDTFESRIVRVPSPKKGSQTVVM